ncbi:hypothetical protein J7337_013779 [Fusarium musae]|uniref:Uncharacterized protein n=1 Tax=Fusarium musae TaxID=1042133 RepID=A0A9P8IIS5_9HYPO|nr:hypothetical protein J7337_013779 [Fusarium musae]KAG9495530.1 hypothetical protein J7337_013779 [Fusarium musae]
MEHKNNTIETENSTPEWRVANYQIPVPLGDCSAHFLIERNGVNGQQVKKAFLMDGGTNSGGYYAWVQILKGLRHIDLELGTKWKFDNWVVTHWDEDHYRGVRDLLSTDLELFRFVQKGEGDPTGRTPPSTFAKQYFCEKPWLLCGALDRAMFINRKKELDYKYLEPFMTHGGLTLYPNPALQGLPKISYTLDAQTSRSWIEEAGLRCITTQPLVGIDLFTRTWQFNSDGKPCSAETDIDSTWRNKAAQSTAQPRFCVIGADGYGIGIGDGGRFVKEPSRNETSILAILYWPGNLRCSYYTGGDGSPDMAKGIVREWLSKHFQRGGQVDLMKLDHHGSTRENLGSKKKPATGTNFIVAGEPQKADKEPSDIIADILIEHLKPEGLLVTPGTQHGHPTWDVLLAIHRYFSNLVATDGLFTTRSFYWLDTNKPGSIKNLNFNHNDVDYMQALYKKVYEDYDAGEKLINEDEDISTSDIENVQTSYEVVYNSLYLGNEHQDDKEETLMDDLVILDQPERVKNQAEFEKEKKLYGCRLKKESPAEILTPKGEINWSKVQEKLTEECRSLLDSKPEKLDVNIKRSAVGDSLFWAWFRWAEDIEDSVFNGALQYSDICWQPIITGGNPHYLISFVFGKGGEEKLIEVFTDDGEFQVIKDQNTGEVSHLATNLVVEHQSAPWTRLVYSPLTLATIFNLQQASDQANFINDSFLKQPLTGIKTDMKLAIDVLFNRNSTDPASSKANSRKELKSAKMRIEKLDETMEDYMELKRICQGEGFKKQQWLLQNRPKRATKPKAILVSEGNDELIEKNRSALERLQPWELNLALKHDKIGYFARHYSNLKGEGEVRGQEDDGSFQIGDEELGELLEEVQKLLSNFVPKGIFK